MRTLVEVVKETEVRKQVIRDANSLIDSEVSRKSGVTGFALKAGYKAVSRLKGGRFVAMAIDSLLDEFAVAIQPLHDEYVASGAEGGFDAYLERNSDRAANALLAITDGKARRADRGLLRKTYEKLRPAAVRHVQEALPGVGQMVERYTG